MTEPLTWNSAYSHDPADTLIDARRLLRSVETENRAKKRSNAAVRELWVAWDAVADYVLGGAR